MEENTLSYVHGANETALLSDTIGAQLDRTAARFPDREALVVVHQDVRWSYDRLRRESDAFAAGLIALGLKPGDRIGIWSQNNVEWVVTQFATAKAGLILVNINPAYRLHELEFAVNKVGCAALILSPVFKQSDYIGMMRTLAPELETCRPGALRSVRLPELRVVIRMGEEKTPGMLNFAEIPGLADETHRTRLIEIGRTLQFDDPINIQFTSGTTGRPKGATLTHHNILNNGYFVAEGIRVTEVDRMCIPVPFYHCFGMVMGNLGAITHGACMVIPGEGFDAERVLQTVQQERCTSLYGVPTMFVALLNHPDFNRYDVSSLRTGIMAGSPCPIEVMRQVMDRLHMPQITIAYGMTETSPVSFQCAVDDSVDRRVSTVGRIHPHVEAKVVDPQGRIVPRGVSGELLARGYSVMRGYWGEEDLTRQAIDSGRWMHTGDLAVIDAEGYCNIVGRIKDMVIRGGENIYPREVEEFLYRHPKIRDIQVFGIPDRQYGEQLCAWVVLKDDEDMTEADLISFCVGEIAHYKIPKVIRFVEAFPMTATGKIQKFVMRKMMIEELQIEELQTA
ncbi:AMP-binding protein [Magnetospirillum molischianum]|uniref:3-methylmercaptopropionyl-CoA ligase n=1 Tax=Magnetospirillum molischianum DSM 120 TaxID=1150626 RepID=H8FS93_MAGML|nr:AMP-binding protein [Magnetospirillum molischianum]CCG41231.1 Acyl-CoA synthetase family member 2, mitochondrial [Magnetospirillum molischianum DSM 120]